MDRSSTVARFIQRFREAAPLSPDQRRRDRQAMEGQFWWAQQSSNSEDGGFETDRSGCGTSSPPPPPPPPPPTDGDGSNRDLEDYRSRGRAPPPYREPTYSNSSEHTTLEASCKDAAPQDARVQSEGGCDPNTDQTTLASSVFLSPSPCSPGPPGPPSDDEDGLHQLHHQTLAGEAETAELAASPLAASMPEHQVAASSFGASRSRLPERSVQSVAAIEGEGCDELANLDGLDARAGSLLEHCRQLLSAPPTDDAEQEAIHPLPASFSFGERSSAVLAVGVGDGASSHTHEGHTREGHADEGHTRQGLEQRAWMLLDNREPLEHWEANLHDSLLPTGADQNLCPVRSNRCNQAAREAVPIEGLALATTAEVDATHGSRTFRKKTISGLGRGESHAWSSEREKKEVTADEGGDSRSLLLRKEFPANRAAPPCMLGGSDEAFSCGRTTSQTQQRYGRETALPELTSATGDLLTGMDSALRNFTEDEMPVGFDCDDSVNVPRITDFGHLCRMAHTSAVEPSWAVHSNLGLVESRPQEDISAVTPCARGGRQGNSSVASLKDFAKDPVIVALVERAHEIEAELERRRLFAIDDGNQPL